MQYYAAIDAKFRRILLTLVAIHRRILICKADLTTLASSRIIFTTM